MHLYVPVACLQLASMPLSMSPRRYTYGAPPELYIITSARLQRASRVPELDNSIHRHPPGPHRASRAPYLHVATPPEHPQSSMPPYFHTFPSRHLQRVSRASCLYTSTFLHPQRASRPPDLHASTSTYL